MQSEQVMRAAVRATKTTNSFHKQMRDHTYVTAPIDKTVGSLRLLRMVISNNDLYYIGWMP